jgi:ERCC4-type nuclease
VQRTLGRVYGGWKSPFYNEVFHFVHGGLEGVTLSPSFLKMLRIDEREISRNDKLLSLLQEKFEEYEIEILSVGDYTFGDLDVCIERKTASDFVGSMGGHLQKQRDNMKRNYKHNFIIIVGSFKDIRSQMNPNAIRGMIASLIIKHQINVLMVDDEKGFVDMIFRIFNKLSSEISDVVSRIIPHQYSGNDRKIATLCAVEGVSGVMGEELLSEFKTLNGNIAQPAYIKIGDKTVNELTKIQTMKRNMKLGID